MNRFRIRNKETDQWMDYEEVYINQEGEIFIIEERTWAMQNYMHKENITEKCEVVWYTGLKDKNGKDIYEGDIVEHCEYVDEYTVDGPFVGSEVVYEDGTFCFKNDCPNPLSIYVELEVVGNIYDNPELISS